METALDNEKRRFLLSLVNFLEKKLGRNLELVEIKALAFFVEKTGFEMGESAARFAERALGTGEGDAPPLAAYKAHNAIYREKQAEAARRLNDLPRDSEGAEKINAIKELMESSHRDTEELHRLGHDDIPLGGVAEYWLPAWARDILS